MPGCFHIFYTRTFSVSVFNVEVARMLLVKFKIRE